MEVRRRQQVLRFEASELREVLRELALQQPGRRLPGERQLLLEFMSARTSHSASVEAPQVSLQRLIHWHRGNRAGFDDFSVDAPQVSPQRLICWHRGSFDRQPPPLGFSGEAIAPVFTHFGRPDPLEDAPLELGRPRRSDTARGCRSPWGEFLPGRFQAKPIHARFLRSTVHDWSWARATSPGPALQSNFVRLPQLTIAEASCHRRRRRYIVLPVPLQRPGSRLQGPA